MVSIWQQLGAFVYTGQNLSQERLARFAAVGGKWIVPVVYNDDRAGPWNLANLEWFKQVCTPLGVKVGCWANYTGEDAEQFADGVARIVHEHNVGPTILDCEASVQGSTKLSQVTRAVRARLLTRSLGISTNSLNDSVVWNGRIEGLPVEQWKSVRRLGFRVLPQWYSSPRYEGSCWADPVCNFQKMKDEGTLDNFHDASYVDNRAVALSTIHSSVEATGMEDSSLAVSLDKVVAAQAIGLGKGLLLYTLDGIPESDESDLDRLAAVRGRIFL